jgi:hypothetical protein
MHESRESDSKVTDKRPMQSEKTRSSVRLTDRGTKTDTNEGQLENAAHSISESLEPLSKIRLARREHSWNAKDAITSTDRGMQTDVNEEQE